MKHKIVYYGGKVGVFFQSIFILSMIVFCLARLAPGDPLVSYYGDRTEKMSLEERERTMEKLGLNHPIHVQYVRWLQHIMKGDFGMSLKYKQDVTEVIQSRLGNTLILGGVGFGIIFFGSLLLGICCAWHEERLLDQWICRIGTITTCIPEFWLSLVFIFIFSVTLGVLPSSGAYTIGEEVDLLDRLKHLVLPLSIVVIEHLWYYAYLVRNKILEEVRKDYVLLAKAKGLSQRKVMFKHCLRNVIPTYLSMMAIGLPHILGGTYIVESVFSYPGLGTLFYESARYQDYNLLMLLSMMTGILVIFCNMLSQIFSEQINPHVKAEKIVGTSEVIGL